MSDRIATAGILTRRVEQLAAGDPDSTRLVYAIVIALLVVGIVLVLLAVWMIRRTRTDMALLAPLERMSDAKFRKSDPAGRRALLDEVRPPGAAVPPWPEPDDHLAGGDHRCRTPAAEQAPVELEPDPVAEPLETAPSADSEPVVEPEPAVEPIQPEPVAEPVPVVEPEPVARPSSPSRCPSLEPPSSPTGRAAEPVVESGPGRRDGADRRGAPTMRRSNGKVASWQRSMSMR